MIPALLVLDKFSECDVDIISLDTNFFSQIKKQFENWIFLTCTVKRKLSIRSFQNLIFNPKKLIVSFKLT